MENRVSSYLEEYMAGGDVEELLACLGETLPKLPDGKTAADLGHLLMEQAIGKAVDGKDQDLERVVALFLPLAKNDGGKTPLLERDGVQALFLNQLEFLDDLCIDVPKGALIFTQLLAYAIAADVLSLAFLIGEGLAFENLPDAMLVKPDQAIGEQAGAAFVVARVLQTLKGLSGEDVVGELFRDAGGMSSPKLLALMPEEQRDAAALEALLTAAELGFLLPSGGGGAAAAAKDGGAAGGDAIAELAALESHLMASLGPAENEESVSNDDLLQWINTNCTAPTPVQIARTVMRCVLETASSDDPPPHLKITKQIEKRKLLLIKYNAKAGDAELQSQSCCLYEVQAFCGRKGWPAGLIKKVFYNLYETDVVFEDAYTVWREDVSDQTPGKDRALFQVNEFLQWLAEAAEEEDPSDSN